MRSIVIADVIKARTWPQRLALDAGVVLGASLLVGLCARISFRVPFSPVPITATVCCSDAWIAAAGMMRTRLRNKV